MKTTPLSANWLLSAADDVQTAPIHDLAYDTSAWTPAEVPGTVQQAMVRCGRAPSPWLDTNAKTFQRFERQAWVYRTVFDVPPDNTDADRFELRFEGISLFATVWLNGTPVGFTDNAHRDYTFDVTSRIRRDGPNVLAVECDLRLDEVEKGKRGDIGSTGDAARTYVRFSQMSFGWDFAPRLVPVGLWRPVSLVAHRDVSIGDLAVRTASIGESAELTIDVQPRSISASPDCAMLELAIREREGGPVVWESSRELTGDAPLAISATVENPELWYPFPLGEPHLYTLEARILRGGGVTDSRTLRFGIRTIEVKQDDQFTFCINGRDVFARGANWVPPNALTLDAQSADYRHLLDLARDAQFNMLRVWGGGTYECDEFYDLCDERGIMVWQDFMYACAMYPDDDPTFMESVRAEAEGTVRRLRSHPCVVLWCGENENQDTWAGGYEWYKAADRHFGARIYEHLLPDIVSELSPEIPWWPGSPFGGAAKMSLEEGDYHDWYDLPDWRKYDASAPRFSSEYGFRSVPQRETVDEMISPEFQWDRNGFLHHAWDFHHGTCNWLKGVLPEFGTPASLDDFIMLSQEAQATLMRYAVEVYRRRMWATSGSLIWQYNEPWPAATFSLVDFFGRPKAAYYWVSAAHSPTIGLFYGDESNPSFWGVTDRSEDVAGTLRLSRYDHSGELLAKDLAEVVLTANSSTQLLADMPPALRIERPEHEFLLAELRCGDDVHERVHHAANRCDWVLPEAEYSAEIERVADGALRLTLKSDGYVHFVALRSAAHHVTFSDNYFDLLPGRPKVVELRSHGNEPLTIQAVNAPTSVVKPVPA